MTGKQLLECRKHDVVADCPDQRETLLRLAPHIIWPLEFVLPHETHLRPAWLIGLGLFLYDRLGHAAFGLGKDTSTLPKSRKAMLAADASGGRRTVAIIDADHLVVVNDTRVFPARLLGRRDPSGGGVECLLGRGPSMRST